MSLRCYECGRPFEVGSGSCEMTDFGIRGVETLGFCYSIVFMNVAFVCYKGTLMKYSIIFGIEDGYAVK